MAKGAARNKKKVLLSFKSEQRRDAVLSLLRNSPEHRPWPFNEANTVHVDCQEALDSFRYVLCPEYVQMCYLHQQSPVDLTEMMENAPPYRDLGDLWRFHPFPLPVAATSVKTFLRYSLLELNRYPPTAVEGFTLGAPQIMDRIEFTTAWLVRTLDEEYTATRRQLAQFVRAHAIRDDRSTTPFWVPLYRTNGPYDDLVHVIGQSAMLDPNVQYSRPSCPRHMESFGYLESGLWYIDWDRSSPLQKSLVELFVKVGCIGGSIEAVLQRGIKRPEKKSAITNSSDVLSILAARNTSRTLFTSNSYTCFHPSYLWYGFSASLFNTVFRIIGWPLETDALPHVRDVRTSNGMHPSGGFLSKRRNVSSKPSKGKGKACAISVPTMMSPSDSEANAEHAHPLPWNFNPILRVQVDVPRLHHHPDFRTAPNTNIGAGPLSSSTVVHPNTEVVGMRALYTPILLQDRNGNIHASSSSPSTS
ncbi:hypothetical protein BS47DRAFT_1390917 [Hydnum rufescens UP504]|uniref:Uncharacterized protein n=1 Tax=Hydnum rufescens UP504 TaxID=1448309 RepID=A0A9P6B2N3_9AGAM|nr:hypothetical protein BS47DRAFT_1390917 [Hydnum rufescens UP504]